MALIDKLKFVARQYAQKPIVTVYTLNIVAPELTHYAGASLNKIKRAWPYERDPAEVMESYYDIGIGSQNKRISSDASASTQDAETAAWMLGYVADALSRVGVGAEWVTPLVPWIAKEINAWVRAGMPNSIDAAARKALLDQYVTDEVAERATMLAYYGHPLDQRPLPPRVREYVRQGGWQYALQMVAGADELFQMVANYLSDWSHPLGRFQHLREIADWVVAKRPNIMGMSLVEADQKQWEWHQAEAEKVRQQKAKEAELDPPVFGVGDYSFYDLTTKAQLKAEGCEQGICVGRTDMPYWRGVQDGWKKIYSMRRGDQIIATIEVEARVRGDFSRRAQSPTILQVKGRFNANITEYAEIEAIGKFAQHFGYDSTIEPWHSWLRGARPAHQRRGVGLSGFVANFGRGR